MIEIGDSNVALASLYRSDETIPLPFELTIEAESYHCTEILRLLPGKRLVVKAQHANGQQLVIKLFVKQKKGERELTREKQGHQLAIQAGVKVPDLIFSSNSDANYCAVGYRYLENAKPFDNTEKGLVKYRDDLVNLAAALHNYGVIQDDFHLENILISDEKLCLIDLASVKGNQDNKPLDKRISLVNLAVLVVQFKPQQQQILIDGLPQYYQARDWSFDAGEEKEFVAYIDKAWLKRKKDYLKKAFRNCTLTVYRKTFSQQYGFRRSFFEEAGEEFVNNIDDLISKGKILKAGNSATVVQINYAGKLLVVKRYNIKSFWHFLRRSYRPSRAAVSWRNGNLLQFLGIATSKPLGFVENRYGWFRTTAYLVCEYSDGEDMLSAYRDRQPTEDELMQLKSIFDTLKKYQISHGDFKATNFLIKKQGKIQLIDLDAMQEHSSSRKFLKAFANDKHRLLANWEGLDIKASITSVIT